MRVDDIIGLDDSLDIAVYQVNKRLLLFFVELVHKALHFSHDDINIVRSHIL